LLFIYLFIYLKYFRVRSPLVRAVSVLKLLYVNRKIGNEEFNICLRVWMLFTSVSSLLLVLQNSFYIALSSVVFPPASTHAVFYLSFPCSSFEFNTFFADTRKER